MKLKNLFIGLIVILALNTACFAGEYDEKAVKAYNNGIDLTGQENYEEAVKAFENAIKIEPAFIDAYYNLGILYQYLNKQDKALQSFLEILKHNPEDYEVIHKIAVIYHARGDMHTALSYLKKIPADDPNYGLIAELTRSIEEEQAKLAKIEEEKKQAEAAKEVKELGETKNAEVQTYSGFEGPTGVARDSQGNLYVANYSDNSIITINNNGEKTVLAQGGAINGPLGLAMDKNDNLYVANYESNQIVVIPASDRTPQVLPFIVKKPYFLMVDDTGILYVTEQGSNSVSQHKLEME